MFIGNHLPELIVLLIVALIIFGPKRLPEIGSAMGKGIREFRKGTASEEDKAPDRELHDPDTTRQISSESREPNQPSVSAPARDRDTG